MDSLNRSVEFALLLTIPAAVALAVIPWPIVHVLFERGAFTGEDTTATAAALAIFAAGLPSFVLIKVFSPAFFAREDTKTPDENCRHQPYGQYRSPPASCSSYSGHIGWMPHLGIALATVVGGWLNAGLLLAILIRRGQFVADEHLMSVVPKVVIASSIMGGMLWLMAVPLQPYLDQASGVASQLMALVALVTAGVTVFFALCHVSGAARLNQLLAAMRRGG